MKHYSFQTNSFDEHATFHDFYTISSTPSSRTIPQISKNIFKPLPLISKHCYAELDHFRDKIEQSRGGVHHLPYTNNKKSVLIYKTIFFSLAVLFLILAWISFSISSFSSFSFIFSSIFLVKGIVLSLCILFSMTSFLLALSLRTERDAVIQSYLKAKTILARIYVRKRLRLGIKSFEMFFGPHRRQAKALKQIYDEYNDKLVDKRDEVFHLLQRIITAETFDKTEKETLLNQAIEEFNDKLFLLSHSFRNATIPHFIAR